MNILLAVDGSDQSYEATQALAHLAPAGKLTLLHVLDVPNPAYPMLVPEVARDLYATVEREMREEGKRVLEQATAFLPPHTGPAAKRLEIGSPSDVILSVAEAERTNLVVLGARGVGAVKELLLGSVSHRVLTQIFCSALVVKKPIRALRHVLLAVQGPDDAELAIQFLSKQPFRQSVEITVLTVLPFTQPVWPTAVMISEKLRKEMLAKAERFADDIAARLEPARYRASGRVVFGAPATEILRLAASSEADLLITGSRGRKGISRVVLGSVSHALLHQAPCSVLVVR